MPRNAHIRSWVWVRLPDVVHILVQQVLVVPRRIYNRQGIHRQKIIWGFEVLVAGLDVTRHVAAQRGELHHVVDALLGLLDETVNLFLRCLYRPVGQRYIRKVVFRIRFNRRNKLGVVHAIGPRDITPLVAHPVPRILMPDVLGAG